MSKHIFAGILIGCLLLFATGCTVGDDPTKETSETPTESATESATSVGPTAETESETEADLRTEDFVLLFTGNVCNAVNRNIGFAGLSALKQEVESEAKYVLLADLGNLLAEPQESAGFESTPALRNFVMGAMGIVPYDYAVPGSRDLSLLKTEDLSNLAVYSGAKLLSANIQYSGIYSEISGSFETFVMETCGERKIALIGIMMPEPEDEDALKEDGETVLSFLADQGADFFYQMMQIYIEECRVRGAEKVILLTHMGNDPANAPFTVDELVQRTTGVTAVLDGRLTAIESRTVMNAANEPVPVSGSGSELTSVGKLVISADGTVEITEISNYTKKDEEAQALIDELQ